MRKLNGPRPAPGAGTGRFLPILTLVALAAILSPSIDAADPADEKPAAPAESHPKPPSYNDDDLAKYHKPKPKDIEEVQEAVSAAPAAAVPAGGPAPATPAKPVYGPPKPASLSGRSPARPAAAKPQTPPADPTAPWKQKDAHAAFRQEQIRQARERIQGLESRLEYLKRKKDAISNPVPAQVGKIDKMPQPDLKPDLTPDPKAARLTFFPNLPDPQNDQDRDNDKTMKLGELLKNVEDEIATVESDLEDAKRDLVGIETRFSLEGDKP